jgi:hypothetical protein
VVERGDLVVEDAVAGAGLFSLVVEGVKAEAERDGNHGEDGECDAQSANGRAGIGEWAGGEIEGYAHLLTHPRERASDSGEAGMAERCGRAGGWA